MRSPFSNSVERISSDELEFRAKGTFISCAGNFPNNWLQREDKTVVPCEIIGVAENGWHALYFQGKKHGYLSLPYDVIIVRDIEEAKYFFSEMYK